MKEEIELLLDDMETLVTKGEDFIRDNEANLKQSYAKAEQLVDQLSDTLDADDNRWYEIDYAQRRLKEIKRMWDHLSEETEDPTMDLFFPNDFGMDLDDESESE